MNEQLTGFQNSIKGYQRHRPVMDALLIAGFLALGVFRMLSLSGVLGLEWNLVLTLGVLAFGVQNRAWGYYAAVAVLLIPLWNLSPYLMTLFVAVAMLPRLWWIDRLPWVLLASAAPLLAEWQVLGVAPLLAGLMGGPIAGLGVGIGSVLWVKLVGGLATLPIDLVALHGAHPTWGAIAAQTQEASSIEIFQLLGSPFLTGSNALLLHVLQAVGWGLAGWLVGTVRRYTWSKGEPRFLFVPALASGALTLWATLFLLPDLLGLQSFWQFLGANRIMAGLALASITTAFVTALVERTRRPVAPRVPRPAYTKRRTREGMVLEATNPDADVVRNSTTTRWRNPAPQPPDDEDEGVIMLEID